MYIKIYQVNKENFREWAFMNYEWYKSHGQEKIRRNVYDKVWEGLVDSKSLEDVFELFNLRHPDGFKGHSMSVSDLVENDEGLLFCDSFGFKKVEWEDGVAE